VCHVKTHSQRRRLHETEIQRQGEYLYRPAKDGAMMICPPLQLGVLEHRKNTVNFAKNWRPHCLSWLWAPSLSAYRDTFLQLVPKGLRLLFKAQTRSFIQCLASALGPAKEAAPSVFCKTHGEKLFLLVCTSSSIRLSHQPCFPPSTFCNLFKHLPWLPRASIGY
jgi:hypothetical protein